MDAINCVLTKLTVFVLCITRFTRGQTCERLDPSLFSSCIGIGHSQTFPLPSSVDQQRVSTLLLQLQNITSKCTVSQNVRSAFYCGVFLPLCVEKRKKPLWPCRRVCAEFVAGCNNTLRSEFVDHFGTMCNVLPDSNAASNECFEPVNFTITSNLTDLSFLGKCHRREIPMCGNLEYNYTTLTRQSQSRILKTAFKKDLDKETLNQSDYSLPEWTEKELSKYKPECAKLLRKLFCATWLPPCFPEEKGSSQYYSLCQSDCKKIGRLCPGFYDKFPLEEAEFCAEFPDEKAVNGFCEHFRWSLKVAYLFRKKNEKTKENSGGLKTSVIAVAAIVPLVTIVTVIIGAWFFWRRYHVTAAAYRKKGNDDVTNIVE